MNSSTQHNHHTLLSTQAAYLRSFLKYQPIAQLDSKANHLLRSSSSSPTHSLKIDKGVPSATKDIQQGKPVSPTFANHNHELKPHNHLPRQREGDVARCRINRPRINAESEDIICRETEEDHLCSNARFVQYEVEAAQTTLHLILIGMIAASTGVRV